MLFYQSDEQHREQMANTARSEPLGEQQAKFLKIAKFSRVFDNSSL